MDPSILISIGVGAFTIVGAVGGIIVRDRAVYKTISEGNEKLHTRVNALNKELNRDFARKDDMKQNFDSLQDQLRDLNTEIKDTRSDILHALTGGALPRK